MKDRTVTMINANFSDYYAYAPKVEDEESDLEDEESGLEDEEH